MPRPWLELADLWVEAVQLDHIESIRQWRNAQMDVLRQSSVITPEQQQAYFQQHIWPDLASPTPRNILLAIYRGKRLVGYGGLVHVAWEHRRAEVSFLLDPGHARDHEFYARTFLLFLKVIQILAFEDLGLHRIFTETYAIRDRHMAVLEQAGFQREGTLRDHVLIDGQAVDSIIHGCINPNER